MIARQYNHAIEIGRKSLDRIEVGWRKRFGAGNNLFLFEFPARAKNKGQQGQKKWEMGVHDFLNEFCKV